MKRIFALALALGLAAPVLANEIKIGEIVVHNPWAKPSPRGADVGAGFMVIDNTGKAADRLIAATAENADHVEIHEMAMDGGVMKMRELPGGLDIPGGGKIELKSGSYHLMLMGLKQPIKQGDRIKGALTFEHAGKTEIEFATEATDNGQKPH
jgi:copper(I)-binding protein